MTPMDFRELLNVKREAQERDERAADLRAGVVVSAVVSAWGGKGARPSDFFPSLRPKEPEGQDSNALRALFVGWAKAHNARLAKNGAEEEA